MSITSDFRKHLKAYPEIAKFVMPSTKYEVLLDLNGDGKCDFAFIDTTGDGTPDSFALDRTGNGEFNLYLSDLDETGAPEKVGYYLDEDNEPMASGAGERQEAALRPAAMKFMITLRSEFNAESLNKALCAYRDEAVAALKALAAEVQAESAQ